MAAVDCSLGNLFQQDISNIIVWCTYHHSRLWVILHIDKMIYIVDIKFKWFLCFETGTQSLVRNAHFSWTAVKVFIY